MGYVLTERALDIDVTEKEMCCILGYLATPGRIKYIEAQVPFGKENKFLMAYPGQKFDKMQETSDKQSFQFRIILNYNGNCPIGLLSVLSTGGGAFYKNCISRGRFVERLVNEYGFEFFNAPNSARIRNLVVLKHPEFVQDFDYGFSLPLAGRC